MIDCEILENGDLKLSCDDTEELASEIESRGFWQVFCDQMEHYSCNGSFTVFDAGQANPFVGLTSATCIAESMSYADNGDCEIDGRLWFDNNYAIRDPLEILATGGTVIFTLVTESME